MKTEYGKGKLKVINELEIIVNNKIKKFNDILNTKHEKEQIYVKGGIKAYKDMLVHLRSKKQKIQLTDFKKTNNENT